MFYNNKNTAKKLGLGFLILLVTLVTITLLVGEANAARAHTYYYGHQSDINIWNESTHPPRGEARLNLLGEFSKGGIKSRLQGVCYNVMEKRNKPYYLYLGAGLQFGNLEIEPVVGWSFRDKEWVVGLRLYPEFANLRSYSNVEYQLETQSFYYIGQVEIPANGWFEWGAEIEGWGDLNDHRTSNGFGLNAVFNFHAHPRWGKEASKLSVEAALQFREMDDQWKPQAIVRFIFTPKMDSHSRSRRRY